MPAEDSTTGPLPVTIPIHIVTGPSPVIYLSYVNKKGGIAKIPPKYSESCLELNAASRLRKTSHLTCSFTGTGGEQFVDVFQFETSNFREDTHHRSDTVLFVVVLQEVDNFLVFFVEFFDTFAFFAVVNPLRAPVFKFQEETIFINVKAFAFEFYDSHNNTPRNIYIYYCSSTSAESAISKNSDPLFHDYFALKSFRLFAPDEISL
jgi:hypothetical protein